MPSRLVTDDIAQLTFELGRCLKQKMLQCSDGCMHMPQMHALMFIEAKPGMTMKELASMMRVTSPSATSFVDRLVKLGFVSRATDATNRRLVRLRVTETGSSALKDMMSERSKVLSDMMSVLSSDDQAALKSIMEKLIRHCSR
jgi:DNA-binding MarR family transcriptional regulator